MSRTIHLNERETHFDERLYFRPLTPLFLIHPPRDLELVALYSGNESIRVLALVIAVVEGLDDDDLLAGMSSLEDNAHFPRFVDYLNGC